MLHARSGLLLLFLTSSFCIQEGYSQDSSVDNEWKSGTSTLEMVRYGDRITMQYSQPGVIPSAYGKKAGDTYFQGTRKDYYFEGNIIIPNPGCETLITYARAIFTEDGNGFFTYHDGYDYMNPKDCTKYRSVGVTFDTKSDYASKHPVPPNTDLANEAMSFISTNVKCAEKSSSGQTGPILELYERENYYNSSYPKDIFQFRERLLKRMYDSLNDKEFDKTKGWTEDRTYISIARWEDLDANVVVDGSSINIRCRKSNCFSYANVMDDGKFKEGHRSSNKDIGLASNHTYRFCSNEIATRLARAFSALIKEKGGKESPF